MRLIDANFAQYIANEELSKDDAGIVQWVLSHTPTIDPESLRPHGRWIHRKNWDKWVCSECSSEEDRPRKNCPECGAKMKEEPV